MKVSFVLLFAFLSFEALAFNEVANGDELRARLGMNQVSSGNLSGVKIAILDNGFKGFVPKKGMLPESAELIEGPLKFPEISSHGLGMAQIVWELTGKTSEGPKFYLVNSNGFTNFKAAVDFVIQNKIDIVLYAQVWTFGSNFDGRGFINQAVNRALDAGVIWVNAAGNLGRQVHNGEIKNHNERVELVNKLDDNAVTLTLTWADFSDNESTCATQDLDVELYDSANKLVSSGVLIQSGSAPDPKNPKDIHSCYARETMTLSSLERGTYFVKVISKNDRLTKFRVIMTETKIGTIEFSDLNPGSEIMPPADNARVLTVGEGTDFSATGPTSDDRVKPDTIVENGRVDFTNGNQTAGSSNAAAMVAGAVTVLKAQDSNLTAERLLAHTLSARATLKVPAGLIKLNLVPDWLKALIPYGGIVRQDAGTRRIVILSRENPTKIPLLQRYALQMVKKNDIIACVQNMSSCSVFPIEQDFHIETPYVEFRQLINGESKTHAAIWTTPLINSL